MKHFYSYFCLLLMLLFAGCSGKVQQKIDYLPCQSASHGGWGFVSPTGEVICEGRFASEPSAIVGGMFTVEVDDRYQLYALAEGQVNLVRDSLSNAGLPAYGLVPVCSKSGKVEVLNALGETAFELADIEHQSVVGTASQYQYGLLKVATMNSLGQKHSALLGTAGEVVLAPHYTDIEIITPDMFWVSIVSTNMNQEDSVEDVRMTSYFIDNEGNRINAMPQGLAHARRIGAMVVGMQDSTMLVYNMEGKRCASFRENPNQEIITTTDSLIVVRRGESCYGLDMSGKVSTRAYSNIVSVDKGLVGSLPDHSGCDMLSSGGRVVRSLQGWHAIEQVEGFGYIACRGQEAYVWDMKNMLPLGRAFHRIATLVGDRENVDSENFSSDRLTNMIVSHLTMDARSMGAVVGVKMPFVTVIQSKLVESFSLTATSWDTTTLDNEDCRIMMRLSFDTLMVRDRYIFEQSTQTGMYGDVVEKSKKKKDGVEFNPEARLIAVDMRVEIADSTQIEAVSRKVLKYFSSHYTKRDKKFEDGMALVSLAVLDNKILMHAAYNPQLDPEVILADSLAATQLADSVAKAVADSADTPIKSNESTTTNQ